MYLCGSSQWYLSVSGLGSKSGPDGYPGLCGSCFPEHSLASLLHWTIMLLLLQFHEYTSLGRLQFWSSAICAHRSLRLDRQSPWPRQFDSRTGALGPNSTNFVWTVALKSLHREFRRNLKSCRHDEHSSYRWPFACCSPSNRAGALIHYCTNAIDSLVRHGRLRCHTNSQYCCLHWSCYCCCVYPVLRLRPCWVPG